MTAYYNEFDPFAAAWLRELIKDGLIMDGDVDERNIQEVTIDDVKGFTRCHFFAGIGGWDYALQLAGWGVDRPVWTGSPPCQPFSAAGKQAGKGDERHLWPELFRLIRECKPATIFGEQVSSAIRHNWLDDLQDNLEGEGYATGAIVLPASSVGAPHKRERLWFAANRVANPEIHGNSRGLRQISETNEEQQARKEPGQDQAQQRNNGSESGSVANPSRARLQRHRGPREESVSEGREREKRHGCEGGCNGGVANSERKQWGEVGVQGHREVKSENGNEAEQSPRGCDCGGVANSNNTRNPAPGCNTNGDGAQGEQGRGDIAQLEQCGCSCNGGMADQEPSEVEGGWGSDSLPTVAGWDDPDWLFCRDGKWRPVKSEFIPDADGLPAKLGYSGVGGRQVCNPLIEKAENNAMRLKGYGNAIVPQVAAEIIKATIAAVHCRIGSLEEG